MKQYTVTEYEQSDFDDVEANMTREKATEVLSELPRGWFPYRLPKYGDKVCFADLDNFRVCCAIDVAIEALNIGRCKNCAYRSKAKVNNKGFLICPASGMEITDDDFCSYFEGRKEE